MLESVRNGRLGYLVWTPREQGWESKPKESRKEIGVDYKVKIWKAPLLLQRYTIADHHTGVEFEILQFWSDKSH